MKLILSFLLVLLSLSYSRAQEAPSSITVENYFCFLTDPASTPDADQLYDPTMQDQIQQAEEGDQITYRIVDGQSDQPMLGLTDVEIQSYSHWAKVSHSTATPLMMFKDSPKKYGSINNEENNLPPGSGHVELHARAATDDENNQSSSEKRSTVLAAREIFPNEHTSFLSQSMKRGTDPTHQEEIIEQSCFKRMPSGSELACYAAMCAQPALLAYSGGIIHGTTLAAYAKGYLATALAESVAIGGSIALPIAGFHLYDTLHARMTPCTEAATRHCLNFQNYLSAFLSSEEPPPTLFQRIEQDKQDAWTAQDNVKFDALQSLQTKLVLKTNNQRQASAEFPDEIVTTVIRELIAS